MVRVTSEVGRLRQVLVHEPGAEVDHMVPAMMEELLFDDILFGDRAREEHSLFRRTMQLLGIEVLETRDLLVQCLQEEGAQTWLLDKLATHEGVSELLQRDAFVVEDWVRCLIEGSRRALQPGDFSVEDLFALLPLPNWCFQRDPQVVLHEGVLFSSMASKARRREATLSHLLFLFHPRLREVPVVLDFWEEDQKQPIFLGLEHIHLEGGDVLVLSPEVVAVGYSQRTNLLAIQYLARALARLPQGPRWLVVVEIPKRRAYMHLDTVMTPVDRDACLVFPSAVLPGAKEEATAYTFDLRRDELTPSARGNVLTLLKQVGLPYTPIPCGGSDPVLQQREQWTDGANAFALAPGVIMLYDRNRATARELEAHGFRLLGAEDLLLGREELSLDDPGRTCVLLPSHEISRARGGPHCLTHPLLRDDLD